MNRSGEFDLIARYFAPLASGYPGALGLTDDAALLDVSDGLTRAVATDMLVEGIHFLPSDPPARIAQKALRVNLSDMAAMGAVPEIYTLALHLSDQWNDDWIRDAAQGLQEDQDRYGVHLVGGDTVASRGTGSLSITVFGRLDQKPLTRSGAMPGDDLYVSGTIGDAGLGLRLLSRTKDQALPVALHRFAVDRYQLPDPRLALGQAIGALAHACIDVSDGLVADLDHLARQSGVAATLNLPDVPWSDAVSAAADYPAVDRVTAGDDYELLLAVPPSNRGSIKAAAAAAGIPVTRIGAFASGAGVSVLDSGAEPVPIEITGYRHR